MSRNFSNWLKAYTDYTESLEAPTNFHYFAGLAAISGALNRKVWFNMGHFKWYPNFYIIIVAKPGIVNKSTTINCAMDMLREVPGVHIGPSSLTWQALVQFMGSVAEGVEFADGIETISAASFVASELGTLIDFRNREMIDVLVDLWDGKSGSWDKMTKMSGVESIANPWISFIAGTTPAWLAMNVPESAVGGGFTSRCIFITGREKRSIIAYPFLQMSPLDKETRAKLVADLEHISMLKGEFKLAPDALAWGVNWYNDLWTNTPKHLTSSRFEGYLARKQTHLHKMAMAISAARRDTLIIELSDMLEAEVLLTSAEDDMMLALDNVGRKESSLTLEALIEYVASEGRVPYDDAIRFLSRHADFQQTRGLLDQATLAGFVKQSQVGQKVWLEFIGKFD